MRSRGEIKEDKKVSQEQGKIKEEQENLSKE